MKTRSCWLGIATLALAACGGGTGVTFSTSSTSGTGAGGASSSTGGAGTGGVSTGSTGGAATTTGTGGAGGATVSDLDGDGLDDAFEAQLAAAYLPFLSIDPADGCPLGGLLYRVRPHPGDPTLINIIYVHLYEKDCGLTGHVGDDEAFGLTVDPAMPPPGGIVAIHAVGHQGTICEQNSECGRCPGETACDTTMVNGQAWPVVYASKDKHANYALLSKCNPITACFDTCTLATTAPVLPLLNAGEPSHHLVDDLTAQGFITTANGWTEPTLMGFNPWDPSKDFGGAGNIASDLDDMAFVPPACH